MAVVTGVSSPSHRAQEINERLNLEAAGCEMKIFWRPFWMPSLEW